MMVVKKALILLLVCAYSVVRGRARKVPRTVNKVLVVQMAKLGDMVCTTPIFSAIKEKYSSAQVFVLGNFLNKEVVDYNPDVDEYIVFTDIKETVYRLIKERFDAAFLAGGPDVTSIAVTFLAGIPLIVAPKIVNGYSSLYDIWYRLISRFTLTVPHAMGHYAPREYLRLLEPIGIFSENTSKKLGYSPRAEKEATNFLNSNLVKKENLIIGVSPSAGNKIKNWGEQKFAELITRLWKKYSANIILIGGSRDKFEVEKTLKLISADVPVINAAEKFSIDGLKALISKMDLFVAVDTGPIYIAEAFGVPTVDIVGPIDEREQPPIGPLHLVVTPPKPRVPQLFVMNAKKYDYREARRQADSITVEMVFKACKMILSRSIYEKLT